MIGSGTMTAAFAATQLFSLDIGGATAPRFPIDTPAVQHARPTLVTDASANSVERVLAAATRPETIAELEELRALGDDWDGQGAAAPRAESIDEAEAYVLADQSQLVWDATLDAQGRAVIEAETAGGAVLLTFHGDGRYTRVIRDGGRIQADTFAVAGLTREAA